MNIPEISVTQLKQQLAGPNPPHLIDVRELMEVSRGMIAGAAHIPMNSIPDRLDDIPHDKPVVIYCASGARSYAVTAYLKDNGFDNVANLEGGILAWAMSQGGRG